MAINIPFLQKTTDQCEVPSLYFNRFHDITLNQLQ